MEVRGFGVGVNVEVPPGPRMGPAPVTGPLIARLCWIGDLFGISNLIVPAGAVAFFAVKESAPVGSAGVVSPPPLAAAGGAGFGSVAVARAPGAFPGPAPAQAV